MRGNHKFLTFLQKVFINKHIIWDYNAFISTPMTYICNVLWSVNMRYVIKIIHGKFCNFKSLPSGLSNPHQKLLNNVINILLKLSLIYRHIFSFNFRRVMLFRKVAIEFILEHTYWQKPWFKMKIYCCQLASTHWTSKRVKINDLLINNDAKSKPMVQRTLRIIASLLLLWPFVLINIHQIPGKFQLKWI